MMKIMSGSIYLLLTILALMFTACKSGPDGVRVADFGAVPGDGKDDSKAVQAAIDHAIARWNESCHI